MLNFSTIPSQPITRQRTLNVSSIEKSKIIDKRVLEVLSPDKELSNQELMIACISSNTGIDSACNRLIAIGKLERIKNPEQEYGKPSYLFRLTDA